MRLLRFLILIAIVALLTLAYVNQTPDDNGELPILENVLAPLAKMQETFGGNMPQLAEKIEQLQKDIKQKITDTDPADLIPIHIDTGSRSLPVDIGSTEWSDLSQKVEVSAEQLKQMNATDLADRMKALYRELEAYRQAEAVRNATGIINSSNRFNNKYKSEN